MEENYKNVSMSPEELEKIKEHFKLSYDATVTSVYEKLSNTQGAAIKVQYAPDDKLTDNKNKLFMDFTKDDESYDWMRPMYPDDREDYLTLKPLKPMKYDKKDDKSFDYMNPIFPDESSEAYKEYDEAVKSFNEFNDTLGEKTSGSCKCDYNYLTDHKNRWDRMKECEKRFFDEINAVDRCTAPEELYCPDQCVAPERHFCDDNCAEPIKDNPLCGDKCEKPEVGYAYDDFGPVAPLYDDYDVGCDSADDDNITPGLSMGLNDIDEESVNSKDDRRIDNISFSTDVSVNISIKNPEDGTYVAVESPLDMTDTNGNKIWTNTDLEYTDALNKCRDIFTAKLDDYGTAWRIMRPQSVTDQIYIKANRIRSLEENGVSMVGEGILPEFMAIVNYGIVGLIQLELGFADSVDDLPKKRAIELYDKYAQTAYELMNAKNHDYNEAWRLMRVCSYTDFILMKICRTKQIESHNGVTKVSEGIDANYLDMINYAIFGIIKLTK